MITTLENFNNRQIIINEYANEELINRNGFFFKEITVTSCKIRIYKNNQLLYELSIPENFHFWKDGTFPNYFVMEWEAFRTEIYFP